MLRLLLLLYGLVLLTLLNSVAYPIAVAAAALAHAELAALVLPARCHLPLPAGAALPFLLARCRRAAVVCSCQCLRSLMRSLLLS